MVAERLSHKKILIFFWNESQLIAGVNASDLIHHHTARRLVRHGSL
jgi:hypothetical protein